MKLSEMLTVNERAIKEKRRLTMEAAQLDKDIADLEQVKREAIARGDAIGNAEYEAADRKQRRMIARRDYVKAALMAKRPDVTRADVLKEWAAYAENYNRVIEDMLTAYEMACRDLSEKFVDICAIQNEALKVRFKLCSVLDVIEGGTMNLFPNAAPDLAPVKLVQDCAKGIVYYQGEQYNPDVAFFALHGLIPDVDVSKYNHVADGYPAKLT